MEAENNTVVLQPGFNNTTGKLCVFVHGEDLTPDDTAGWVLPGGKRIKNGKNNESGESASAAKQSRPRERENFARRIAREATKAARMPSVMPRDDVKIIIRPRGGLNIARTEASMLMSAILTATRIRKEEAMEDMVCPNPVQNIIVVSTPDEHRARLYARLRNLTIGNNNYEVWAYQAAMEGTVKGVIKGISITDTEEEIRANVVNAYNPKALQTHRIGTSTAVIV